MSDAAALVPQAFAAYERGELDAAERLCRAAVGADETAFDALHLLAVIQTRQGRPAEALATFDAALQVRPDFPPLLSNRGNALRALGQFAAALASHDRALAQWPDFPEGLANRGVALQALGRLEEALASADKALALRPEFPEALANRGRVLNDLRRFEEALASTDEALAVRPGYLPALVSRGISLAALGRLAEAQASCDEALAQSPEFAEALSLRGTLLRMSGQISRAAAAPAGGAAIRAYAISLARRPDRRERFLRWNEGKGIELVMFDAVDGRELSKQELIARKIIADETLGFSSGALGNALSHHALWETCVALGRPIWIFEDDAFLPQHIKDWVEPIDAELANGCDIFFIGYNRDAIISFGYAGQWCNLAFADPFLAFDEIVRRHDRPEQPNGRCILDVRLAWGTLGYAISPRGAQTLLKHCFPMSDKTPVRMYGSRRQITPYALDGVINVMIQQGWVKARTVFPPLVVGPNELTDSDVVSHLAPPSQARPD